ncbi:prolyl oligopeptidase family serine peptidase [Aquimarina sp. 2201CG14-23]|uniref:prolyl oligopeptidase family serine peptidase n=1 Tax=Aquimarina mycalae TaxID=3040073 RepID=UPI002477F445|nr:prolyl oligopeptidase family serine peptidase [Aquimarina sp. 2201CG14-23]MDH7445666.1 prolyl oligopeptidase family serine peptidase [Aquimarina sp. 2201CG14-23]
MKKTKLALIVIGLTLLHIEFVQSQIKVEEDPYLWLEEVESEKSLDWVKAQNEISKNTITSNALFDPLKQKYLETFNDKDKIAYPSMVGDYVYNFWRDEHNERGVLRRMLFTDYTNNGNNWEVILDLDLLSKEENKKWVYKGVDWLKPDNKICLIILSDGGKDENEIREFNVETKSFVKNGFRLKESKGGASWIDKDNILIYRNFGEGTLTNSGYPRQVKIWKRGTAIEEAKFVFETDQTNVGVFGGTFFSDKKRHAFVYNAKTFYDIELYNIQGEKLIKIDIPKDAQLSGYHKNQFIISLQSDWKVKDVIYKKGSLVSLNFTKSISGELDVKTIYQPNNKSSFVSTSLSKDFVVVNTMENVQNNLIKYTLESDTWVGEKIDAPQYGSIYLRSASGGENNNYFFTYSNFITPTTLYFVQDTTIKIAKKRKESFSSKGLVVKQNMVTSKDGTLIPYFIVHKENLELDGSNSTLIYAYGGFNSAEQPSYSSTVGIGWLEQGGVYVLANIRGGGEFGPSWHQAALKEKRQNAYDDFYAVSEDLIAKKITAPAHLGAYGWSNGGLLAGVIFTQRPDLYNAVVVGAPLLDMKRYSKLLAGASWMGEYGNPDIPEEWAYIKKYSPYHNVFKDKKYPEVLFVTSTKDDRVHPGHARKMAAKMKDMGHPFLYHETVEGGHGGASTNEQSAYMLSSIYTYLNMKLKK